jgi:parallel beta-helix repeat protein
LEKADRNQVRSNRVVRDGVGIFVFDGDRNVIAGNRIAHAIQHEGEAIELPRSDHNVIVCNSIRDTTGIAVHVGGVGNVVRRNHISGAGKDGVRVVAKAKHILLRRNHARHSEDDGIDVNSRTTKLTRNRAMRNADLGIEAVRGVIDGGGNKASGNGDPRQCTNIVCS